MDMEKILNMNKDVVSKHQKKILTIPNILSFFRLCLIPLTVWLYFGKRNYYAASGMILLSGLTDIVDGVIARRFQLVSDLGKILDPVADKLTQAALIFCLISKYDWMLWLFVLLAIKEMATGVSGFLVIKKTNVVNSAQWFGKLSTAVLYTVIILLFLFPNISAAWANAMILLCAAVLLLSMVKYLMFHAKLLQNKEM